MQVIICPLWPDNSMPILRDPKTCMKWCVGRRELRGRTHFPQYCAGIGYVVSRGLVPMLYNASLSTPFFWIDDVYVTGLLAKKLPVSPTFVDVLEHFSAHDDVAVQQYNDRAKRVTYWYVHAKDENNYWTLWRSLMKRLNETQRTMINADVLERWAPSD
jgi:Galactosyltransferase